MKTALIWIEGDLDFISLVKIERKRRDLTVETNSFVNGRQWICFRFALMRIGKICSVINDVLVPNWTRTSLTLMCEKAGQQQMLSDIYKTRAVPAQKKPKKKKKNPVAPAIYPLLE